MRAFLMRRQINDINVCKVGDPIGLLGFHHILDIII